MNYINEETRTESLRKLAEGESILLAPYQGNTYARESASIKSTGARLGVLFIIKKALVVVEDEAPFAMIRVTHGGPIKKQEA
ncbi:hypothetical protein [Rosenbergiella metrosideri]|uniref:hypothetical protein n=1 Tax=Rosenbergiella metrosideri TaxID=2921185 RepID=UPI001F4F61C6|nr:hypothetical protein [Rosenbergiella metrosideri]